MKNRGMGIKHPKVRGEWVELRFMMRALELGLHLNKPWGEVMPYDLAVEDAGQFMRVQVKSTMFKDRGGYSCTVRGSDGPYEGDPFEYLAAYVFQEDLWYIIPAELVVGQGSIALYPKLKGAKYGPYKEAWHLLRNEEAKPSRVGWIEAGVEEMRLERASLGQRIWRVLWGGT
jgi:hypothetical protein